MARLGPPRAHEARLPPSRNGTPASRSAAAAFFSVASMSANGCSSDDIARLVPGYGRRMAIRSESPLGRAPRDECAIRIAATGDIHLGREGDQERWAEAFAGLRDRVDLVLLAGDLTTHGEPEQAAMVAAAVRGVDVPVLAVLGNHDWHVNRRDEVVAVLQEGGIDVLEREHRVLELCGTEVGDRRLQGVRRRLRRRAHPGLRRAADARGLRRVDARGRGARRGAARDRALPVPDRAAALRADHRDAARASAPTSGRSSAPTGSRRRCASTIPTSSCTATPTPARSRERSARCRSSTSRSRCWARTSGSSS